MSDVETTTLTKYTLKCDPLNTFSFVCIGIISILVFFSNLMTIIALRKSGGRIGQKAKLYIISVSCADFLLSPSMILSLILSGERAICKPIYQPYHPEMSSIVFTERLVSVVLAVLYVQSIGSSLVTLLSLAIDRLMAISKPLFYKNWVTTFSIKCWLGGVWCYVFILIMSVMTYSSATSSPERILQALDYLEIMPDWCYSFVVMPHLYLAVVGNVVAYVTTFYYIRKLDSKITDLKAVSKGENRQRSKRYIRMGSATVGFMLLLWSPFILVNATDLSSMNKIPYVEDYLIPVAFTLVCSNAWINPIIYCWLNKDYRKAYMDVFRRKHRTISTVTDISTLTNCD